MTGPSAYWLRATVVCRDCDREFSDACWPLHRDRLGHRRHARLTQQQEEMRAA